MLSKKINICLGLEATEKQSKGVMQAYQSLQSLFFSLYFSASTYINMLVFLQNLRMSRRSN